MTQEEKAKAYDKALERAKKILCNLGEGDGSIRDIETIFPELAESEDERVRKFLVKLVSNDKENNYRGLYDKWKIDFDDVLVYLEKQKEQKPIYNLEIPAGDVAPAEEEGPFDEDEFLENELSAFLQNYDKEYDDDAAISDVAKHFYELGKKVKQKPAEWSEEDKKMLQSVICEVVDEGMKPTKEQADWLKSIRSQPKQEWDEEDEKKMEDLVSLLWIIQGASNVNEGVASKYEHWLKSLRERLRKED